MKTSYSLIFITSIICGGTVFGAQKSFYEEFSLRSTSINPTIIENGSDEVIIKFEGIDAQALSEKKIKHIKREVHVETDDKKVTRIKKHLSIEIPALNMTIEIKKEGDFLWVTTSQDLRKETYEENSGYLMQTSSSNSSVSHFVKGALDIEKAVVQEVEGYDVLMIIIPRKNKPVGHAQEEVAVSVGAQDTVEK